MMKDLPQKRMAVRFCASQKIVPFMEVLVRSDTGLDERPIDITDIDVLGLDLSASSIISRYIFDCKSGTKQMSPVNRALWASGLCTLVGADRAYIIQQRETLHSHKIAANSLGIHIHSEKSFERYAASISPLYLENVTYLDNPDAWNSLQSIGSISSLKEAYDYAVNSSALEISGSKAIRLGIAGLLKSGPELDPKKINHRLLFGNILSSFLISLFISINKMKDIFDFTMSKEEFEVFLRYFIWDGKDNYIMRKNMKMAIQKSRGEESLGDLELPDWERFVNLVRMMLDAPEALRDLPFLAKELAFRSVALTPIENAEIRLKSIFWSDNRARQFLFLASEYLVRAANIPREFSHALSDEINQLLEVKSSKKEIISKDITRYV